MSFETIVYGATLSSIVFVCVYAFWWLPRQIREDYRQGLLAMARTVEMREGDESGSAAMRARYAERLARSLRLPRDTVRDIELAALLQEIGKVAIPYRILNKGAPLTYEEAEVLKLHPVVGQHIIQHVPSLSRVAPIIRYHHENWDGSGYPDRLRGEEIPLASRVLRIVGDFVELLRQQGQQDLLAKQRVLQQMEQGWGTLYDPLLLQRFRDLVLSEAGEQVSRTNAAVT